MTINKPDHRVEVVDKTPGEGGNGILQEQGMLGSVDTAEKTSLWQQAFESLSAANQRTLEFARDVNPASPDTILKLVAEKREACVKRQWVLYTNRSGEAIKVRDVLNKVCGWVEKFEKVGYAAVQLDPCHAAIPWMVVKALLQVPYSKETP